MTQYLLSVPMIDGAPPRLPDDMQQAYEGVARFNVELQSAGAWVFAGPAGVVRDGRPRPGGEVLMTDGPFTESKEHIGGVWIIEAIDLETALAWATKAARACGEPVEVRPFQVIPEG